MTSDPEPPGAGEPGGGNGPPRAVGPGGTEPGGSGGPRGAGPRGDKPEQDAFPEVGEPVEDVERGWSGWRTVQGVVALVVLAFFLYSLRSLLSPFILFWVLVAVLLPFRRMPGHTLLVAMATVLIGMWILETMGFLLAPFVLAMVLAYILDPVADRIQTVGPSRSAAIVILALPVLGAVALIVFWGIPALSSEIASLVQQAPALIDRFAGWLEGLQDNVLQWDIPLVEEQEIVERLRSFESEDVIAFLQERRSQIAEEIWGGILGLGRGIGSVITVAGYVFLTPVLTFFLLRDWDEFVDRVEALLPRQRRDQIVSFVGDYDDLLSRYLRGQILVALIIGSLTAIGLLIAQFPYALLLGAIVTIFSVVPYLGLLLSLIPALIVALVSGQILISLLKLAIVYGVAQGLEGAVISPRILGGSVGLHPVWVVLALAVGGFYFGFVGLLIGVPLAVGVKLVILRGIERYQASALYSGRSASHAS